MTVANLPQSGSGSNVKTIEIAKITITETGTAPLILTPTSVPVTCGQAVIQMFTVSNPNNVTGITSYEWDLGSANNGWLYLGSAAPQNISTTSNSITLTSICGSNPSNVTVTVRVNNQNYKSYVAAVSTTIPALDIDGSGSFCSGNPLYSIPNLPCNAAVSWSATPSGIVNVDCPNCTSTTLTKVGDGQVTLTATIVACGSTITKIKNVNVGLIPLAGQLYTSPYNSYYLDPNQSSYYICFTQSDISLNFAGATNLTAYAYSGPYVTSIVGTTIYWAYDSYNYSQTLRVEYDVPCGHVIQVLSFYNTCSGYYYRLSPNPSKTEVTVSEVENSFGKTKQRRAITELNIYDGAGNLKKHQKFGKVSKASLNISGFKAGVYILEIIDGTFKERQQLIIQE